MSYGDTAGGHFGRSRSRPRRPRQAAPRRPTTRAGTWPRWAAGHDLRLRLISDEEPFDGPVHHDVLVRGAGQPTVSLSLAAGPGLPWPLRGMSRSSAFYLVEVDGRRPPSPRQWRAWTRCSTTCDSCGPWWTPRWSIKEIDRLGLELTGDELQAATEAYRRARCLYTAQDTAAWLADRGLTPALFARQVEQHALVAKLRRHVAGPGVAAWLDAHAADLGMVVTAGLPARWSGCTPSPSPRSRPPGATEAGLVSSGGSGSARAGFAALATAAVGDLLEVGRRRGARACRRPPRPGHGRRGHGAGRGAGPVRGLAGRTACRGADHLVLGGPPGKSTGAWTMRAGRRRRVPAVLQSTRTERRAPGCALLLSWPPRRRVPLPALRASLDPGATASAPSNCGTRIAPWI